MSAHFCRGSAPMARPADLQVRCRDCDSENAFGAAFCISCGAALETQRAATPAAATPTIESDPDVIDAWNRLRDATLGDYDIYAPLGRGGMATVFLARDLALDRDVAIKVLATSMIQSQSLTERFKREARTSAALSHPNIIPVYAVKEIDGLAFFVMKYVDGRSLDSIIREEGPLALDITINLLRQVGDALHFAHRKGVIHRDVKPANVMIDQDGWAIVTDFGIAKVADASALTSSGLVVGTPAYMSPEQFSGSDITGAADQYSLGVVAYEMLTGHTPFGAATVAEMMRSHIMDAPESPQKYRPDISTAFAGVVLRMLSKEASDRWPNIGDAVSALESLSKERQDQARSAMIALARSGSQDRPRISVPISPSPSRVRVSRVTRGAAARRRRQWLIVGAGATLVTVGLWGALYLGRSRPVSRRDTVSSADSSRRLPSGSTSAPENASGATPPALSARKVDEPRAKITPPQQAAVDRRVSTHPSSEPSGRSGSSPNNSGTLTAGSAQTLSASDAAVPGAAAPASPPLTDGFVLIGSRIPTAVLYVDGTARGFINRMRILTLPARGVRIGVHAEGCEPWDSTVTVPVGDTLRLNFRNPTCPP